MNYRVEKEIVRIFIERILSKRLKCVFPWNLEYLQVKRQLDCSRYDFSPLQKKKINELKFYHGKLWWSVDFWIGNFLDYDLHCFNNSGILGCHCSEYRTKAKIVKPMNKAGINLVGLQELLSYRNINSNLLENLHPTPPMCH